MTIDVSQLTADDLKKLSDDQIRIVQQERISRINAAAKKRVEEVMKGDVKKIAEAMTTAPFTYLSPEIKIMSGYAVRFSSLMKVQSDDAYKQTDNFIRDQDPSQLRAGDHLTKYLLAYSLTFVNGIEFGATNFDVGEYQSLRTHDAKKAEEILFAVRDRRLAALENLSPLVYQRLIEFYNAFQLSLEAITRGQEMEDALGN